MSAQAENSLYLYFGIDGSPFSIAPDPHFLYLGDKHQEALAHLFYGIGNEGGFIVLTGEVGTGKTTICRTILQQMPEGTDVAYIVNPRLTANELLQIICDELGLFYNSEERTNKVLLDILTKYLLASHSRGRHTLLIIDEAQNLSADVLEQIRLLTNLETNEKKLLQLVLIGQPELGQMLASRELRQLSQRVTARYHLQPLTCRETGTYITHRLRVAGFSGPLFTAAAVRAVYRHARGTPRLINVLCERCMLGAYVSESRAIDRRIVRRAIRELREPERRSRGRGLRRFLPALKWAAAGRLALALVMLVGLLFGLNEGYSRLRSAAGAAVAQVPAPDVARTVVEAPDLQAREAQRERALRGLAHRWRLPAAADEPVCAGLAASGLACLEVDLAPEQLLRLGLPAVASGGGLGGGAGPTLLESERDLAGLQPGPDGRLRVWLFWRQPPRTAAGWPYGGGDRHAGVAWLQQRLAWYQGRDDYWNEPRELSPGEALRGRFDWLYAGTRMLSSPRRGAGYDAATADAVRDVQRALGWQPTGEGDLLTLIKLDYLTNAAAPTLITSG